MEFKPLSISGQDKTMPLTRRGFLQSSAMLVGSQTFPSSLFGSQPLFAQIPEATPEAGRLVDHWEFYRGSLDPDHQIWHSDQLVTWEKVVLPHCVNHYDACDPDIAAYRGESWYRTTIAVGNPYNHGRTLLHFEGAGQSSKVYVGDKLAVNHEGGYDEFFVDITNASTSQSQVQLAVLCDNGRRTTRMPSDLSDFTLYGGLYRAVHLLYVPAVSLEAVHTHVKWEPGSHAEVKVTARMYAPMRPTGQLKLVVTIFQPDGSVVHRGEIDRDGAWDDEIELTRADIVSPHCWFPQNPQLYRCEVTLRHHEDISSSSHRFGILHARWEEHGPFYLNGERLALRGTQRHEDHANYAAAMPEVLIRQELRMIKDMGANFLRLAHYQQSRLVLDLCDELGIFVWEEVPWCRSGIVDEAFREFGKSKLRIMIDQHRNHVSVLLWGLGNEDDWPGELGADDHEGIRTYMQELQDLCHALDATRKTAYRRCDFARDIPDIYSPSIWAGWYSGEYTEYRSALETARPTVKHLFHAEWGADSHAGRHAEDPDPALARIITNGDTAEKGLDYKLFGGSIRMAKDGEWSETYACDLFDWHLKTLEELPWLTGSAQWVFKDFTTPLRIENPVPRVNEKGLVTRDMQPKEGYYVFQSYWSTSPMLRIYGHSWPVRWGRVGQSRLVRVYSNCSSVELFLNNQSLGIKSRDPQDFPCAGLRWSACFREGMNELRAQAKTKIGNITDAVRFRYETRPWLQPAALSLQEVGRSGKQTKLQAVMLDANGVRCLDSRAFVRFSVAGNGRLIDNLGSPGGSRLVQLCNGAMTISIEHRESVQVAATSNGIPPVFLSI